MRRSEAQKQRNITLQLMHDQGFITQQEYEEAVNTPLVDTLHLTSVSRGCMAAKYDAGYFCDYVVHKIENSPEFGKTAEDRERLLQEGIERPCCIHATRLIGFHDEPIWKPWPPPSIWSTA